MISMTKDLNASVTNKTLNEAVDVIMKGMDKIIDTLRSEMQGLFGKERKFNMETFATKEDLKREASWLRDDIKGLTADLSDTVAKKEFSQLKTKVDKYLAT